MEKALMGIRYLKNIQTALETNFGDVYAKRDILYNYYDFINLDIKELYDELLVCYEYGILREYEVLLDMFLNQLPGEFERRRIGDLSLYFSDEQVRAYENCIKQVKKLNNLLEAYERNINSIVIPGTTNEEVYASDEYYELEDVHVNFGQTFQMELDGLVISADKFNDSGNRANMMHYYQDNDRTKEIKRLYHFVKGRLYDITQPEDVFIDETIILMVYKVFTELDLIEEVDKKAFKDQLRYRDRTLTIRAKNKKKILLTKTISRLSHFVFPEYKDKWEIKMANHFKIKSYSKNKNKKLESEEEKKMGKMIEPFMNLF